MEIIRLHRDEPAYSTRLAQCLTEEAPSTLDTLGNLDLLLYSLLAFFASVRCPGRLILQAHDLAQDLRRAGVPTIGGFHSPVEQEVLIVLLRGEQPIVVCPARSLIGMRIPREYRDPLEAGRLLLLSPFAEHDHRATVRTAQRRNRLVAASAAQVFVAYAAPGGKTEAFCREILAWGKPLYTFAANENLVGMGAQTMTSVDEWM